MYNYILVSSLLVLGALFVYYFPIKKNGSSSDDDNRIKRLPPGTFGWPIIGETLAFGSTMLKGCPEKFVGDRMKKYGPTQVFKTSILGEKMAVLYGAAGNKLMFSNKENKLVGSWWPSSVIEILTSGRGTAHMYKVRICVLQFVKPEAVQHYIPAIQSMVDDHLQRKYWIIPTNKDHDHDHDGVIIAALPLLKELAFAIGCQSFIGIVDPQLVAKLFHLFNDVMEGMLSLPIKFPGTPYNQAIKSAARIRNELIPMVREKREQLGISTVVEQERRDLFSHLIHQTHDDGKLLSDLEIADQVLAVLIASHDTTSSNMATVMYFLADFPDCYARVLEEQREIAKSKGPNTPLTWKDIQKMKYSWNVASEVLRLASSPGVFREVLADFTFGGCLIQKGMKVFLSSHATHLNPECFPNPKQFDPSRFEGDGPMPYTFVPFGGGQKICPGREFARVEILTFMHCLVTKFRWEKLFPDEQLTYKPVPLPVKGLPIRIFPHES